MPRRFAVLGHPVAHSLSPAIHAEFYFRERVNAVYERAEVTPDALPAWIESLKRDRAYDGLNVTYPHKEAMFAETHPHDMVASVCRAVNTLGRTPEGYSGSNTDGEGFCLFLEEELAEEVRGMRAVMLGAGGSARSVLWALSGREPASLTVVNRSARRFAEPFFTELAARTKLELIAAAPDDPETRAALEQADLVIHATPVGLGADSAAAPWPVADLTRPLIVDLNYRRAGPTPFLATLPENARAHDGLGMLLYQAAAAFELWFGRFPDARGMLANLRKP